MKEAVDTIIGRMNDSPSTTQAILLDIGHIPAGKKK